VIVMKIAVIGAGKMGFWLAQILSEKNEVAIFDLDKSKTDAVKSVQVLSKLDEIRDFDPQMVINSVSLQNTILAFKEAESFIPKNCMICDVASIKGELKEYYQKCGFRFISVHPMFGPTFANMDSLREHNAIIIKESDPEGVLFFLRFFGSLGLRIFEYTFDEHDQMMAYSLTTPFVSTLVFASCLEKGIVPGSTFAKHKTIAKGLLSEDDHLLSEILFNSYSTKQLEKITSKLEFLKHILRGKDKEEMKKFLDTLRKNIE